jgi:hypothetical protein
MPMFFGGACKIDEYEGTALMREVREESQDNIIFKPNFNLALPCVQKLDLGDACDPTYSFYRIQIDHPTIKPLEKPLPDFEDDIFYLDDPDSTLDQREHRCIVSVPRLCIKAFDAFDRLSNLMEFCKSIGYISCEYGMRDFKASETRKAFVKFFDRSVYP